MGMYDSPKPPPAPDYAAATRAGAEANAQLLPLMLGVDRAARLGTSWTDPETGKVYDFSGLGGDQALLDMDIAAQRRLMEAGADISRGLERNRLQDMLELMPQYNRLNLDAQRSAMEEGLRLSEQFTRNQLEQDLAYRPRFGDLTRAEDARTFRQNLDLGVEGTRRMADLQTELLPRANMVQRAEDAKTFDQNLALGEKATRQNARLLAELQPFYGDVARGEARRDFDQNLSLLPVANRAGLSAQAEALQAGADAFKATDPARYALMEKMLTAAQRDLDAGSSLTDEQRMRLEQNVRGAQAARGNILGAGAGYDEARMASEMGQSLEAQRRAQALAVLTATDLAPKFSVTGPGGFTTPGARGQPVEPVIPNYQTAPVANPLMPNYGSTQPVQPSVPGFQATTAGGPNLSPTPIGRSGGFSYMNPGMATDAAAYARSVWQTQAEIKSKEVNPWMAGLSLGIQGFSAFKPFGI